MHKNLEEDGLNNDLIAYLRDEEETARQYQQIELQPDRVRNLSYLLGRANGNEEDGRSQVISTDVWDALQGMMPALLKPFTSTDEYVKFEAVDKEDEQGAEQETDYLNYVIAQKNNGYMLFYNWFWDALINKYGIVEYGWEESTATSVERYQGLNDDELAMLLQNQNVKIEAQTDYPDQTQADMAQPGMAQAGRPFNPRLHDVTVRITNKTGSVKINNIPTEEFVFNSDLSSASIKDARFVQREVFKTISQIRELGYDIDDDIADSSESISTYTERANRYDNYIPKRDMDNEIGSNRLVLFKVAHCRYDANADGISELLRIVRIGDTILEMDETEEIPYSAVHCHVIPHRFAGVATADVVVPIQDLKTTLWRQALDNVYGINSNRVFVSNRVDLDDMLSNPLGGIVRVDAETAFGHVSPAPITPIIGVLQPMIEYADSVKENRTGFTRYNSGLDANSLNKTATGITKIMDAANQRLEMQARTFAETGIKDLMLGLHGVIKRNSVKEEVVRLRNKWVTVDPRQWRTRTDMTVSVGLGTGDRQQQIQQMQMLGMAQEKVLPIGLADRKTIFNALRRGVEAMGYKDVSQFFIEPEDGAMPPPPPNPDEAKMQGEMQLAQAKLQNEQQFNQAKLQDDQQRTQAEMQMKQAAAQQALQFEQEKLSMQMQIEKMKLDAQINIEQAKLDNMLQLEQYKVDAQMQLEQYKINTNVSLQVGLNSI